MSKVIKSTQGGRDAKYRKRKAKRYKILSDMFEDWHTDFRPVAYFMYYFQRFISFGEADVDIVDTLGDPS